MRQANDISTYRQFWPYYLREHAQPLTRAMHFFGTGLALAMLGMAVISVNGWFVPAALISGYGPAWAAHFMVEHNRPATFRFPLWSLFSDVRMAGLWLAGRLSKELEIAGVEPPRPG